MMADDDDGYLDLEEERQRRHRRANGHDRAFNVLSTTPVPVVEFSAGVIPPRRWLYGHRLLRGAVSMLIAPPGTGKTMLMIEDALCIVSGRPFLGFEVHDPGPVWVYNAEEPQTELDRRLLAAMETMHVPWPEIENQLFLQSGIDEPWDLAMAGEYDDLVFNEPLIRSIVECIRDLGIVALYVDPLIEVHRGEENSNLVMKDLAGMFQRIAHESDAAVCFIQHTPKTAYNSEFAGRLEAARGGGALGGKVKVAETLFTMSARDAERLAVEERHRLSYVRLDDAKGNYARREGERWFRFASVKLANGDDVGVLVPADFDQAKIEAVEKEREQRETIVKRLMPMLREQPDLTMTFNKACLALMRQIDGPFRKNNQSVDLKSAPQRVRREVEEAIRQTGPINDQCIEIIKRRQVAGKSNQEVTCLRLITVSQDDRYNEPELL